MITEEKRSVVVRYWFEKAEESMASARRESVSIGELKGQMETR